MTKFYFDGRWLYPSDVLFIIDDGHGINTAGKRSPDFADGSHIKENEFNWPTAQKFASLAQKEGFETFYTAPELEDVSLGSRVRRANAKAKAFLAAHPNGVVFFVSFHYNAMKSTWDGSSASGLEVFHYRNSKTGTAIATAIYSELKGGTEQVLRGVKEAGFYVLKYTSMPAILIEAGFMDDEREVSLMKDENFQWEVAKETMQGYKNYLGIKEEEVSAFDQALGMIKMALEMLEGSQLPS